MSVRVRARVHVNCHARSRERQSRQILTQNGRLPQDMMTIRIVGHKEPPIGPSGSVALTFASADTGTTLVLML
jgi:hypothetical protein